MTDFANRQLTVVRTERGLSVAGTRITLYAILDYLRTGWPPKLIQMWFGLTDFQMGGVLRYIESHLDEVEREYRMVIEQAEQNRQYLEEKNRNRIAAGTSTPEPPERAALRTKLEAWKGRITNV